MPHRPERLAGQVVRVADVRDWPLGTLDAQVVDVPAGAERTVPCPGQDHHANVLPIAETGEHLCDLQICRTGQGINGGPVDRDLDDAVGLRDPEPGRAHAHAPTVGSTSSLYRSAPRPDSSKGMPEYEKKLSSASAPVAFLIHSSFSRHCAGVPLTCRSL